VRTTQHFNGTPSPPLLLLLLMLLYTSDGKIQGIDSRHRIKVIIFDSAQSAVTYRPAANIDSELSLRAISNLETPNNKSNITARYKSIANHKIRPAKCDNIAPLQPPGVQSPLFSWLLQIESFNHIR